MIDANRVQVAIPAIEISAGSSNGIASAFVCREKEDHS
jgi:hypothetical protein